MTSISVLAAGMVTIVGFNYQSSCSAIRAGVKGFREVNLWDAENGEYLQGGKVDLPHWWEGTGKLADLVSPAIEECLLNVDRASRASIPILLGVAPADRAYRVPESDEELLDEIEWRLRVRRHPYSAIFPAGNVSGLLALAEARRLLQSGSVRFCIVAGVDSFLKQPVIESYLEQSRVMTKTNSNGFLPSEAGCAVLVGLADSTAASQLRISGIGFGHEAATIASTQPLRGTGQVEAARNALQDAGIAMHRISYRQADLSGEHYKFKEAMFTQGRLLRKRLERQDIWHPSQCVGEIGAAHVPCVLATSLYAGEKGFAPGPRSLCHFSGDGPDRAACVTEYSQPEAL